MTHGAEILPRPGGGYPPDGGVIFRFAELYFDSEVIFRLAAELYFASQSEKTKPRSISRLFIKVFGGARGDFFQKVPSLN